MRGSMSTSVFPNESCWLKYIQIRKFLYASGVRRHRFVRIKMTYMQLNSQTGSRRCSTLVENEKVSGANHFTVETWKLEVGPLDLVCTGAMWNKLVPNVLQENARRPACTFAHKPIIYSISTNLGPQLSATSMGYRLEQLRRRERPPLHQLNILAGSLFCSIASNMFVPLRIWVAFSEDVFFSLGCLRI
jgi:hypothetical protein